MSEHKQPRAPIDILIDQQVEFTTLPPPEGVVAGLYATHAGILAIGGFEFRVYQLNDGQRIIDGEDMERFFGFDPAGSARAAEGR